MMDEHTRVYHVAEGMMALLLFGKYENRLAFSIVVLTALEETATEEVAPEVRSAWARGTAIACMFSEDRFNLERWYVTATRNFGGTDAEFSQSYIEAEYQNLNAMLKSIGE